MEISTDRFPKNRQYYKFCLYGFLKNQRFFDPFIILFFKEMGLSFFEIGTLYSIREISTNILEIPTGVFADSCGRRKSMISAFVSYIISFLIFYSFNHFILYAVAMIFFAFGEAFRTGTHKAMILEYLNINSLLDHRVNYYGHTRSWSQFGSAISSIIAAALVFYSGSYRIIFLASVLPYIANLFLMISYPKELNGSIVPIKGDGTQLLAMRQIKNTFMEFLAIFQNKKSFKAIVNSSLFDGMFKSVKDYLQPILKQYAVLLPVFITLEHDKRASLVIGIVYFILFLFTTIAARSAGQISVKMRSLPRAINVNFILGALMIMASGIALLHRFYILSIAFFILFYLIENVKKPMNVGYFSEMISCKVMATGLSGESQLKSLFVAVLSPLIGFLADTAGLGTGLIAMALILIVLYPFTALGRTKSCTVN